VVERLTLGRKIENHVAYLSPFLDVWVVAAHGGREGFESVAPHPELPIEWHFWKSGAEPRRGIQYIASAGDKPRTVPVRTHSVELLANPVFAKVDIVIDIGE
jgi:hypothetical protein